MEKRAGGARRNVLVRDPELEPTKSVPAAVQLDLLSQSILDLPRRYHFYQRWKVQRMERLLESIPAVTTLTAINCCISTAQNFFFFFSDLLLVPSTDRI